MTFVGDEVGRTPVPLIRSAVLPRVLLYSYLLLSCCLLSCGRSNGLLRKVNVTSSTNSTVALRTNDTLLRSSDVYLNNVLSYLDSGLLEINISDIDSVWAPLRRNDSDPATLADTDAWPEQQQKRCASSRGDLCGVDKVAQATVRRRSRRISIASRRKLSVASMDTLVAGGRDVYVTSSVSASQRSDSVKRDSLVMSVPGSRSRWSVFSSLSGISFGVIGIVLLVVVTLQLIKWTLRRLLS